MAVSIKKKKKSLQKTSLFCPNLIYDMLWSSLSENQELGIVASHQYSQITA